MNKYLVPSCSLSPPWFCLFATLLLTDSLSAGSVSLISSLFWHHYKPSCPGELCAEAFCPAESSVFRFKMPNRTGDKTATQGHRERDFWIGRNRNIFMPLRGHLRRYISLLDWKLGWMYIHTTHNIWQGSLVAKPPFFGSENKLREPRGSPLGRGENMQNSTETAAQTQDQIAIYNRFSGFSTSLLFYTKGCHREVFLSKKKRQRDER